MIKEVTSGQWVLHYIICHACNLHFKKKQCRVYLNRLCTKTPNLLHVILINFKNLSLKCWKKRKKIDH